MLLGWLGRRVAQVLVPGVTEAAVVAQGFSVSVAEVPCGAQVFSVPGVALVLNTHAGPIRFTPLFFSKQQLEATFGAARKLAVRAAQLRRAAGRRHFRGRLNATAAQLAGAPPTHYISMSANLRASYLLGFRVQVCNTDKAMSGLGSAAQQKYADAAIGKI